MTEPIANGKAGHFGKTERFGYESVGKQSSMTSSDYSSGRELSQNNSLEKSDGRKMYRCTCCPYGEHQAEGYYKVKPAVDIRARHPSSVSSERYVRTDMSEVDGTPTRRLFAVDSHGSELSSPESMGSPLSTPTEMHNSRSHNVVTKTTTTITSSNILPATGENESLTISPEAIKQIKEHTDRSNRMIKELQDQLRIIPQLQERVKILKEDKRVLAKQLQNKSGVSSMRSIGVGDYDVDEDQVKIERIKQTVTQQPVKAPSRSVGVGVYDVNTQLYSQAEVLHTVAEHVQKIREKEIHSWMQEAENEYEARKASTRSFGVGDKDVWDEENRLIKEKEMRTIFIGQQDKPSQRNVGLQVKPSMRDVCIEYSLPDARPATRSFGVNVDIGDIIQEMTSSQTAADQQSGLSPLQQQQSSWSVQKHVIQRKFMEAMTTGKQEDLVNFITGLLKRSVRSVGTTAKPNTAEQSTLTQTRSHDKGVGDDVIDVIVKPFVHTKDAFALAKPATRTQPTWTDLLLTCDAATNTQANRNSVDRGVNTAPPPPEYNQQSEVTTTVTKRHVVPPPAANQSSTFYHDKSQLTKTLPAPNLGLQSDVSQTIRETTVTERRTSNTKPDVERKYHTHIDRMVSPAPRSVELDIKLPRELTASEKTLRSEEQMRETQVTNQKKRGQGLRSRSLSGDRARYSANPLVTIISPRSSSTKRVFSEEKPYTTLKETTQTIESGDTVKKETTIERTFSSKSRKNQPDHLTKSLADFDYFGTNYAGSKPKGHAERMERYGSSVTYSTTGDNVNEERNKTELHGNPLKSRYTIEEMSGGAPSPLNSQRTQSGTKSLLRDKSSPRSKKAGVKFADELSPRSPFENDFEAGCVILQKFLDEGGNTQSPRVVEAKQSVQQTWFDIGCARLADGDSVMSLFEYLTSKHSPRLLDYVINMADNNGNTALHYSVSNTNYDVMKVLLQTGVVSVNVQNKAGYTPVMLAALCEPFNDSERNVLRLLLLHADVNIAASQAGQTALMLAVSHGKLEMVKLLLESNADLNLQDVDGSTALMCATEHDQLDIVKTLLAHPDVNVLLKENDGCTALDIALEKGHEEIGELLERAENAARSKRSNKERWSSGRVPGASSKNGNFQRSSSTSTSKSYTSRFV